MAVIKKTLFPKNLDKYAVLVNDTQSDSKYFKITELSDTFTGGKNAFLIAGSEYLVPDTKIQIELKDSAGNVIYHEPGEGLISSSVNGESFISEYYEGVSKVVSVYVYPDTTYGPCTLTILGELSEYQDSNGVTLPVPLDWENKYNIKWQKQIDVNPSLANTTKIRFYQRPSAKITELLSPLYRIENDLKVASNITQSFADIKLSRLETFAGDVKRIKVFRTSLGDISDYDLIQDILVESKELLTTFGLSGSVVGQTGIITSETLKSFWNTGSLNAFLTSSRVESGVRLTGSGYFTYSSSLDIKSTNTYELNLDAFYSASTSSNLGIYLSYVSQSTTFTSSLATLVGATPTKNLLDTVIPFRIDRDYPSASLYFSQSQGEWHLGNISLRLSQDTAFSPDEVSFVTTMPTVLGNETYNFKFEFYDVNNNYVPVEVTQSALFTGGNNNINGTLTLISSSASGSLADLNRVSSSISGTMTVYSSSASSSITVVSGSVNTLSGSVSSSISALSSSVSSSNVFILSSSLSKVQQLANGQFSGSFIGDTVIYSPTLGGQQGYISDLFKVGTTPSIYLDARQNPRKIFIGGVSDSGSYNNSNTSVYMDSTGKFSLGNQFSWNGSALTVNGTINVTGGNAATDANALLYSARAAASASISASAAQTNAISTAAGDATTKSNAAKDAAIATAAADATTKSNTAFDNAAAQVKLLADGGYTGTFISSKEIFSPVVGGNVGYFSNQFRVGDAGIVLDGTNKRIYIGSGTYGNSNTGFYVDNSGNFSLGNKLTFNGSVLSVNGGVTATTLTATTSGNIAGWTINGDTGLSKSNGTHTISLSATDASYYITRNSTNQVKVKISPDTTILPITINAGTIDSINYQSPGQIRFTVTGTGTQSATTILTATSGRGDGPYIGNAGTGVIYLENPTEEIWVDSDGEFGLTLLQFLGTISVNGNSVNTNDDVNASYSLTLVAEKYASWTDARDRINRIQTYRATIAQTGLFKFAGEAFSYTDYTYNISGGGFQVDSNQNWFYVYLEQKMDLSTSDWVGNAEEEQLSISMIDYGASIKVQFGRVDNGYSQLSPAGLQVYTGVRTYMNASVSGVSGENFFEVKGKSQFLSGLSVNGTFSASTKQFQITHPLNENKWLYHTAIEGPQADLIYRGKLNLINGEGSSNIDISSRLTNGTFNSLTRNPQLFLQNNDSFDRIKGKIENGNVYVVSENQNSSASVDWTVIAERCDTEVLTGGTYGGDGKYKTEKWKKEFRDSLMITGSV
jgi:hypothetical protein